MMMAIMAVINVMILMTTTRMINMMTMVHIMIWPNLNMKPVPGKGEGGDV